MEFHHTMQIRISVLAALLLSVALFPSASVAQNTFSFAPAALHFKYVEYSNSGQQLDKETGVLPGVVFAARVKGQGGINMQGGISFYDGRVSYDGRTQLGAPHQTKTDETLTRMHLVLGRTVANQYYPFEFFLRLEHVTWDRDIQSTNSVSGLYEQYRWYEVGAGIRQWLFTHHNDDVYLTFDVFRVNNPAMTVDLTFNGYGVHNLYLGNKSGVRAALDWQVSSNTQLNYSIAAFYEQFGFGASDSLSVGGAGGAVIREPRSETRQVGVQINLFTAF